MSEPIIGQADIHKMIMSLNFRDCHAKIRMVDAQATLGNGVVIQVSSCLQYIDLVYFFAYFVNSVIRNRSLLHWVMYTLIG